MGAYDPRVTVGREAWLDRIGRLAAGGAAVALVAAWSFGEAIVLPIVPDVALYLLALAAPRRAPLLFGVAVGVSIIGSALLFALALGQLAAAEALVLAVPGVDQPMLDAAKVTVAGGDPTALGLFGPGTPLKVYTVAWASGAGSWLGLMLGVIVNRLTRIGPLLLLATGAGAIAPHWLRRHERVVLVTYALAWVALYVAYWSGAA